MWFRNRLVNPVVRLLLRSPLHPVLSHLRQPTRVRLRLQGRNLEGTATASSDPEAVAAGLRHYLARYPG